MYVEVTKLELSLIVTSMFSVSNLSQEIRQTFKNNLDDL